MDTTTGTFPTFPQGTKVASLGGGHGLFQTLTAVRLLHPDTITAIVTVADDGGSSGRIRRELGQIPPGDLRMALSALAPRDDEGHMWEATLQHRFGGSGALAGHAVGNMLIAGLYDILQSEVAALDVVAKLIRAEGRVLPVCEQPLEIEAEVGGLDADPRIVRQVRGQVAVATTVGSVRRVRLVPENAVACEEAMTALQDADLITLGPGSWFTSVVPHLLVPGVTDVLARCTGMKIVVVNLEQHAASFTADVVIVDEHSVPNEADRTYLARAAANIGAKLAFHDVREEDSSGYYKSRHDPKKLAAALGAEYLAARGQ